ncbi:acyl-CoA dehydrogenase [Sorangium cellulosum]|uniref:Acyl-CoA dehydrogenase n=1 Tax=Sorangium cellulosum TaxID=56 RepID=A0A2L0EJJ5_SORCE|nr:acyl-CoA dehydrogenase family protein [Sorangium cellulosum]AUX39457.1 acyl-CoA dehydrogenase [Sorangium cellulosum]
MRGIREQHATIVSRKLEDESPGGMREAISSVEQLARVARGRLRDRVVDVGAAASAGIRGAPRSGGLARTGNGAVPLHVSRPLLDRHQLAGHALAHLYAEIEACRALDGWASEVGGAARAVAEAHAGALLLALRGGVDLGGGEIAPLGELELRDDEVAKAIGHPAIAAWARDAGAGAAVGALAHLAAEEGIPEGGGVEDERVGWIRHNMRDFVERLVEPLAPEIHRRNGLIPESIIRRMGDFGVFRLAIAPEHGGDGLGVAAMVAAVEELARGSLGFGVLAMTTAIAADLLARAGTELQRRTWMTRIGAGEARCALAFSEPAYGSDLARVVTRAERQGDGSYLLTGKKAWVTGASRADLVFLLAKTTAPSGQGHQTLGPSLFAVAKRRGAPGDDFPDAGLGGTEMRALGQRGMGHYELRIEGLHVGREALLGEREGEGIAQIHRALVVGRIYAAACGVGAAQAALEQALARARARVQFGAPLLSFPRVGHRLGGIVARVSAARQLTRAAAQAADAGRPCELTSAMAKLFSVRAAWDAADACMQIHGANGYAEASPSARLLLDARSLFVHMGTQEVLAHGIARALLEGAHP